MNVLPLGRFIQLKVFFPTPAMTADVVIAIPDLSGNRRVPLKRQRTGIGGQRNLVFGECSKYTPDANVLMSTCS